MPRKNSIFDQLMLVKSSKELQERPNNWWSELTLLDANKLLRHIESIESPVYKYRIGFVHTYTSDLLDPWLSFHAAAQGIDVSAYHAPYGLNLLEASEGSGLMGFKPDLTVFMLTRQDLHPELNKPITGFDAKQQSEIREAAVDRLLKIISHFRKNIPNRIAISILPGFFDLELGLHDQHSKLSENTWWAIFKTIVAERINDELVAVTFLDLDELLTQIGRDNYFDLRYWYSSRFPFKPKSANEFSRILINLASIELKQKVKVIVLDADNTLWGGVIGEDGMEGIALGPEYPGNTFMDFQCRILSYLERGFILAICSKNNHQDVIDVLQNHPHQVLKENHFSALRINWQPKTENLKSLAEELNLGLDSFVFVDDSDYECGMVRQELPQVQVIQVPSKPIQIPTCLDQLSRLHILSLTEEDKNKTHLYAEERQRKNWKQKATVKGDDIDSYLSSLEMKMNVEFDPANRIKRLAQLTNKTNQFNLTTHRYSEKQIQDFIEAEDWLVASFSLSDIFGDSGVVGLAIIKYISATEVFIDTMLMSCRVIGRKAESAFIETLMRFVADAGVTQINSEYIPTNKNKLVSEFYNVHDFSLLDNYRYSRSLKDASPKPENSFPIEIIIN